MSSRTEQFFGMPEWSRSLTGHENERGKQAPGEQIEQTMKNLQGDVKF